jgi:hypothetical protein
LIVTIGHAGYDDDNMDKLESCLIIITYLFSNMTLILFYREPLRSWYFRTHHIVGLQIWIVFFSLWPELDPIQSIIYVFLQMIIIYFITQYIYDKRVFILLNLLSGGLFLILREEYYHLIRFFIRIIKTLSSMSGILVLLAIALIILGGVLIKYKKSNFYFIFLIGLTAITIFSFVLLMNYEDWAIATASKYSIGNDEQLLKTIIHTLCLMADSEFNARIHDMLLNWYQPTNDRRVLIYIIDMLTKRIVPENAHDIDEFLKLLDESNHRHTLNKIRHFTYYLITYMYSIYLCITFGIVVLKYKKSNFFFYIFIGSAIILKVGTILLFTYEYWIVNPSSEYAISYAYQLLKTMTHTFFIQVDTTIKHIINDILLNWYPQADDRRILINIIHKLAEHVESQRVSDIDEFLKLLDEFNHWHTANKIRHFIYFSIKCIFSFICLIFVNKKTYNIRKKKYF